jgi:hypothetical protein
MHKTIVWTEPDDRITLDYSTEYEISNALTTRVKEVTATFRTYLDEDEYMVDVSDIHKDAIKKGDLCTIDGRVWVKLTSTRDIVRCELNKKKSPLTVMRIIQEDGDTIYAEKVNINDLHNPVLAYFR